jgi:hypothetical protein
VASLPFAIGLYLPITTSAPLILGGLAAWYLNRRPRTAEQEERLTLLASGLVAGDALMGIGVAALFVSGAAGHIALRTPASGGWEDAATLIPFMVLLAAFLRAGFASWIPREPSKHVD